MMSNDFDFENYYSNNILRKSDFYSIADMLYQINNLWMLSDFIHQNRQFLFNEVRELTGEHGKVDFSTPCRLGQDTMLSRIFRIMKNYSLIRTMATMDALPFPASIIPFRSRTLPLTALSVVTLTLSFQLRLGNMTRSFQINLYSSSFASFLFFPAFSLSWLSVPAALRMPPA